MQKYIAIFIFILFAISCKQKSASSEVVERNKIKSCKIYSADFVLLDPDDKGLLLQEFKFNQNGYVNELIRYDINGNVIGKFDIYGHHTPFPMPEKPTYFDTVLTVLEIDSLGEIQHKEIKTYNKQGRLIEVSHFNGADKLQKKNTYQYNTNGFIAKDIYWDVDLLKPKQVIRYEYDYFEH